jgi:hypothetical protein
MKNRPKRVKPECLLLGKKYPVVATGRPRGGVLDAFYGLGDGGGQGDPALHGP